MRNFREFIKEQKIYENLLKEDSNILLEELRRSLIIWSSFGISSRMHLFESSKYHFEYLDEIVNDIFEWINTQDIPKEQNKIFDFSKYDVFFKKLILKVRLANKLEGGHEKENLESDTVSFELTLIKDKPINEYSLYETKRLNYLIIHELCHIYENKIMIDDGNPNGIFYDIDSKEYKKYTRAVDYLISGRSIPKIKEELVLCGYFLDEREKFAYIGTIKQTIKNIFGDINPTYEDLKFEEILKLFSEEFIWNKYVKIDVFIKSLDENEDKDLRYKIWRIYNGLYDEEIPEDEIIEELKNKWEDFKKEFMEEFLISYDECASTMKLEKFIDMDFSNRIYE